MWNLKISKVWQIETIFWPSIELVFHEHLLSINENKEFRKKVANLTARWIMKISWRLIWVNCNKMSICGHNQWLLIINKTTVQIKQNEVPLPIEVSCSNSAYAHINMYIRFFQKEFTMIIIDTRERCVWMRHREASLKRWNGGSSNEYLGLVTCYGSAAVSFVKRRKTCGMVEISDKMP